GTQSPPPPVLLKMPDRVRAYTADCGPTARQDLRRLEPAIARRPTRAPVGTGKHPPRADARVEDPRARGSTTSESTNSGTRASLPLQVAPPSTLLKIPPMRSRVRGPPIHTEPVSRSGSAA